MFFEKLSALFSILLGSFLLIFVGGKLMLQLLAIIFGFILIARGCNRLMWCNMKISMKKFCDL